jgi:hypothetical protein
MSKTISTKTVLIVLLKGALLEDITWISVLPKLKLSKIPRKVAVFKISAKSPLPSGPNIRVVMMDIKKPTTSPKICVKN